MKGYVSLYAMVAKIDSKGCERDIKGFYEVPKKWLVDNYISKWFNVSSEEVTDDMIEQWYEESEYVTCSDCYWDAVKDGVVINDEVE